MSYRYKGATYYALFKVGGKQIRRSWKDPTWNGSAAASGNFATTSTTRQPSGRSSPSTTWPPATSIPFAANLPRSNIRKTPSASCSPIGPRAAPRDLFKIRRSHIETWLAAYSGKASSTVNDYISNVQGCPRNQGHTKTLEPPSGPAPPPLAGSLRAAGFRTAPIPRSACPLDHQSIHPRRGSPKARKTRRLGPDPCHARQCTSRPLPREIPEQGTGAVLQTVETLGRFRKMGLVPSQGHRHRKPERNNLGRVCGSIPVERAEGLPGKTKNCGKTLRTKPESRLGIWKGTGRRELQRVQRVQPDGFFPCRWFR